MITRSSEGFTLANKPNTLAGLGGSKMRRLILAAIVMFGWLEQARAGVDLAPRPILLAQIEAPKIIAPKRIDTDQETIDVTGRIEGQGEVRLTANGIPVDLSIDGAFRLRRSVPVGRSRLLLVAENSRGGRSEHRIFVRRTGPSDEPDFGDYYAIVIGNNNYRDLRDLGAAIGDARAVAELLEERYGFEVDTLIDATRYDIVSALARMRAELTENDNLLIYYAGHGNLDVDSDEGYWLPVDAARDNPVNWVSNSTITAQLRAMRSRHVLVVADSCYSGRLTRDVNARLRTGYERGAWLRRMAGKRSRTALTSGGLEPVLDAGGGTHSVFARAFLDTLRSNSEILDGQSLFDAIKRPVAVNADQTPEYADIRRAGHDGGDFLFVPVIVDVAVTVEAPEPPASQLLPQADAATIELVYWQSIQGSSEPSAFDAYLARYPDGMFADIAQIKRASLLASATDSAKPAPPESDRTDIELAFWNAIKDSTATADYRAYIEQFPDGNFIALARARLVALERAAQRAAEEAARREAERMAAAEAARLEAERKAAEKAAREEAERKAAEETARRDAERKAAEAELERLAAEKAVRKEKEREAAEESARREAERKAVEEARRKLAAEAAQREAERKAAEESARREAERKAAEAKAREQAEMLIAAIGPEQATSSVKQQRAVPDEPKPASTLSVSGKWVGRIALIKYSSEEHGCKVEVNVKDNAFKEHFNCKRWAWRLQGTVHDDGTLEDAILYTNKGIIYELHGPLWDAGGKRRNNSVWSITMNLSKPGGVEGVTTAMFVPTPRPGGSFDGDWRGIMRCGDCEYCTGPFEKNVAIEVKDNGFVFAPDMTYNGEGAIDKQGNVKIRWKPTASSGSNKIFLFDGRISGQSLTLRGKRGPRSCEVTLSRVDPGQN